MRDKALRILYGLNRIPEDVQADDSRLPGVALDSSPLRLNTCPLPPRVSNNDGSHAVRIRVVEEWLSASCDDYAPRQKRFISLYFAFIAEQLDFSRTELEAGLARFDGLYNVDDWAWSALRPLPRAWLPTQEGFVKADVAFWDGQNLIAIALDRGIASKLTQAGIENKLIEASELQWDSKPFAELGLPKPLRKFWERELLPMSPFRRSIEPMISL